LAVVTDNIYLNATSTWSKVVSASDYYPFGLSMPGRSFQSEEYRYGFNGKEKDEEGMGGGGSTYDYGFRIYNPGLGKFLSVDPLTKQYPELTPYQFASNRPIDGIDRDGLEFEPYWASTAPAAQRRAMANMTPQQRAEYQRKGNITGVAVVGGALFSGFGLAYLPRLATALLTISTSQTVQTLTITGGVYASKYGPDIGNFVYGAATDDPVEPFPSQSGGQFADAGAGFRKLVGQGGAVLDFFGGIKSKYKDALNIDPQAMDGFRGTIQQFKEFFGQNKFSNIIADNPYGYANYLEDAADLLQQGGTITVRGK
jgi:RHS repeat-associated protein